MTADWKKVESSPVFAFEKKGDELIGLLVSTEADVGPNNSKLYTVEQKGGKKWGVWGSTVLDTRLKNVMVGEEVKIVYLGLKKSDKRKGAEYKDFEVYHRMPEDETSQDIIDSMK